MTVPVSSGPDDQPVDAPAIVSPSLPDRADAPVSEVAERFLRAIIANVPLERIEELHLFSPLRQGTVETGIAVLAARELVAVTEPAAEPEPQTEPELPFAVAEEDAPLGDASIVLDEAVASTGDEVFEDDEDVVDEELVTLAELDEEAAAGGESRETVDEVADADVVAEDIADAEVDADADTEADTEADAEDVSVDGELAADTSAEEADEAEVVRHDDPDAPKPKVERLTVYTARYRYVIKGPERGKWEASVKAEADAPLITVETVVRGVQRRAGEESEIVRYTSAQIARALRIALPG